MKNLILAIALPISLTLCAPVSAQISGHHNLVLSPVDKPADGFRTGLNGEPLSYHVTSYIGRPYFGQDDFLGRDSLFLFAITQFNAVHSPPCDTLPSGQCWQDFNWQDAEEGLNYFNGSGHWDTFADPCDIPGDETWMFVINPATAGTQSFAEGSGADQPAWHNLRRISPCEDQTYHSYAPSDPFLDHSDSHRIFLVLDQSDAVDFVRWRIQSLDNRNDGPRFWARSEASWDVLAEVSSSLRGVVDLLNLVCVDDGQAAFRTEGGMLVLDVVEKACVFNFLVNNGQNRVGRLHLTIDFRQAYPYVDVRIMNQSDVLQQLTRVGDKWVLDFIPGASGLFNTHVVQSFDNGTLYSMRRDAVSGTSFCGGSFSSAFRLYRWPNIQQNQPTIWGSPALISKSAAGNPPGSTFLPTTFDRHLARFTFGASGDFAASGGKWDPHSGGLPFVCSSSSFFNMGVVVEPYN